MRKHDTAPRERLKYLEAVLAVDAGLEEAVRLLTLKRQLAGLTSEQSVLGARCAELEIERASIHSALSTYLFDDPRLNPPHEAVVAAVAWRSQKVFQLLPQTASPSEILALAGELIDSWLSILGKADEPELPPANRARRAG